MSPNIGTVWSDSIEHLTEKQTSVTAMSQHRKTPVQVETVEPAACSVDLRLSILQKVPFFSDLPDAEIRTLNDQFREYGFQPGEPIYFSGEKAATLYVVASGQVKLLRHSMSGQDVLLDILKPGDYFGSLTTLADELYPDTAQAHTAVCVLSIQTEAFRTLLQQYPPVALTVLDITARRLQETQEIVRRLSADSVEQRIAAVLLKLAQKLGEISDEGILIQMPLSRDDLAQMTGTTTETASRIISQFQKEGLVHSGRKWIVITGRPGLKMIAAAADTV
ncbi:MAG: Crp/Fnr family transcriptional regulator [Anaerolineae bacterium]|nr:Crp/Fnr family transcriptional regulator [Anaerolineae bacterium]